MQIKSALYFKNQKLANLATEAVKISRGPIIISLVLTPVRFSLELAGLPEHIIFPIGLLWLTLAVAIYWSIKHNTHENPILLILFGLIIFSPISRIPVFLLWWITKTWHLGTHYDIFDNWVQALVGQLFYGSLIQIVPGIIVGAITMAIKQNRNFQKV